MMIEPTYIKIHGKLYMHTSTSMHEPIDLSNKFLVSIRTAGCKNKYVLVCLCHCTTCFGAKVRAPNLSEFPQPPGLCLHPRDLSVDTIGNFHPPFVNFLLFGFDRSNLFVKARIRKLVSHRGEVLWDT